MDRIFNTSQQNSNFRLKLTTFSLLTNGHHVISLFNHLLYTLLKKHKVRVHTDRERSHLCNQCGSMYMEKTQLWAHIAYIHGKSVEDSLCFSCGKIIRTEAALHKHILDVHGKEFNRTPSSDENKPFKCETCLQEFSDIGDIRKHFRGEYLP